MFQKWFLDLKATFLRFPLPVALCLINAALAALFSLWKISLKFYGFLFIILAIFSTLPIVGAFDLSSFSQQKALENILENNNLLQNGKLQKAGADFSKEAEKEISRKIQYLSNRNQEKYLQELFELSPDVYSSKQIIQTAAMVKLNLKYDPYGYADSQKNSKNYITLSAPLSKKIDVENYKAFYNVYSEGNYVRENKLILSKENLEIEILTSENKEFLLKTKSGTQEQIILTGKVQNSPLYQEYKLVIGRITYDLEPENTAKPIEILNLEAFVFLR